MSRCSSSCLDLKPWDYLHLDFSHRWTAFSLTSNVIFFCKKKKALKLLNLPSKRGQIEQLFRQKQSSLNRATIPKANKLSFSCTPSYFSSSTLALCQKVHPYMCNQSKPPPFLSFIHLLFPNVKFSSCTLILCQVACLGFISIHMFVYACTPTHVCLDSYRFTWICFSVLISNPFKQQGIIESDVIHNRSSRFGKHKVF